jgi:hypothetical protein
MVAPLKVVVPLMLPPARSKTPSVGPLASEVSENDPTNPVASKVIVPRRCDSPFSRPTPTKGQRQPELMFWTRVPVLVVTPSEIGRLPPGMLRYPITVRPAVARL